MSAMIKIECKRIFGNKISILSLLGLLIWIVVIISSSILQESVIYDFNMKRVNGFDAIQLEKEHFTSYVVEDDISDIVSLYQAYGGNNVSEEAANYIVYSKELFPTQQLADFFNKVYGANSQTNTAIFHIDNTSNFYQEWQKNAAVDHPLDTFTYGYAKGWEKVYNHLPDVMLGILLCLSICLANRFSENVELHTSDYMQITKKGKRVNVGAKIIASFVFTTMIYWVTLLVFSCSMLFVYGFDGATTSVQILLNTFYPQNMNMIEAALKLSILGFETILSMMCIFLLLSSLCKSSFKTSVLAILMVCIPYYASSLHEPSFLLRFLPMNFIDHLHVFNIDYINFFGHMVELPTVFIFETIGIMILCCILIFTKELLQRV